MHLPTPQFSRLVTVLSYDLTDPSLDSMIVAWDHISTRFLRRLEPSHAARIESIRLLAIHDAVVSIFGPGESFIFRATSTGTSLTAALAATAQASHDILASVFRSASDLEELAATLTESLSLLDNLFESSVGRATGSASAAAFLSQFKELRSIPSRRSDPHRELLLRSA